MSGSKQKRMAELGLRMLEAARRELFLSMRYLGPALGRMDHVSDLRTPTLGTDAVSVRFNPRFLLDLYAVQPEQLNRIYMHVLTHALFGHMFATEEYEEEEIWDLSCDIAAESLIDSLDNELLYRVRSDLRETLYGRLENELRVVSAQQVYAWLLKQEFPYEYILKLKKDFTLDDHRFWKRSRPDEKKDPFPEEDELIPAANLPLKEEWKKTAERVRLEMETSGSEGTRENGRLSWMLSLANKEHPSLASYLKRFAVWREEIGVDPDSFDLAYYTFGLKHYGNIPLIEPLETVEKKRIETLIFAIDTSASTKRTQVRRFLEETASLLAADGVFFSRADVRIIECDEHVQKVIRITDPSGFIEYAKEFEVRGGYGTDFRPVFDYIRKEGLEGAKGLLYFTDGYGIYPKKPPRCPCAFVFCEGEDYDDTQVPPWAAKVWFS